jgi:hypothetical protein
MRAIMSSRGLSSVSLGDMGHRYRCAILALGAAALPVALWLVAQDSTAQAQGQMPMYRLQRTVDGKPNLSGIWQALNEANWNIQAHAAQPGPPEYGALFAEPAGVGIVEGDEIPYQPWALAKKKEHYENRFKRMRGDGGRDQPLDPEAYCHMPGVPRATYMPFPFQIIQSTNTVLIAYPFANASRLMYFEKAGDPPVASDSYMGWSRARWEGDTLVVDVTGFNGKTWFDRAGNFHSDELHVIERYTAVSPDAIAYEALIEDPKVFTRPWKMSFPLYRRRDRNMQVLEFNCVPFFEELVEGQLRKHR